MIIVINGANALINPDTVASAAAWDAATAVILQNELPGAINMTAALKAQEIGAHII